MSHPTRRKARPFLQPVSWLLPVLFSVAAITAVAVGGTQDGASFHAPIPAAAAAPVPCVSAALPAPAEDSVEVTEHVQAF